MESIEINKINVRGRTRKEMGNVRALADSIQRLGLLHPVVVTPENKLVVGRRRIEAYKELGKTEIPANIATNLQELELLLEAERDENSCREPYRRSELKQLKDRLFEVHRKTAMAAQQRGTSADGNAGGRGRRRNLTTNSGKVSDRHERETLARIAKDLGTSATTLAKIDKIVESGDKELIAKMDETDNVDRAIKELRKKQAQRKFEQEARRAKAVTEWKPDIHHCSMEELLPKLSNVDAIITDPPYPEEFIPLYGKLAQLAKQALSPNGILAVMCGQSYLHTILKDMTQHLEYRWILAYQIPGKTPKIWHRKVNNLWKPILIFGPSQKWIVDTVRSDAGDKLHHHWGQSEIGMSRLVALLTEPGQLVCDPFLGAGTTGVVCVNLARKFIGCDLDKKSVDTSTKRMIIERKKTNA